MHEAWQHCGFRTRQPKSRLYSQGNVAQFLFQGSGQQQMVQAEAISGVIPLCSLASMFLT